MPILYGIFTVGIAFILIGFWFILLDRKTKKWTKTTGTILSSQFKTKINNISDSEYYQPEYKCEFIYEFFPIASNKSITGNKLTIHGNLYDVDKEKQLKICEKLSPNQKVSVYYNPNNPNKNCLIAGKDNRSFFTIILGVIIVISVIAVYLSNSDLNMKIVLNNIETISK